VARRFFDFTDPRGGLISTKLSIITWRLEVGTEDDRCGVQSQSKSGDYQRHKRIFFFPWKRSCLALVVSALRHYLHGQLAGSRYSPIGGSFRSLLAIVLNYLRNQGKLQVHSRNPALNEIGIPSPNPNRQRYRFINYHRLVSFDEYQVHFF
jgi:hypothetical protein